MPTDIPVTKRMKNYISSWEESADRRAVFLSCYLLMTENMLNAIEADQFHDAKWVYRLLHRFADYYFEALSCYEKNRVKTPQVWVRVHDMANQGSTQVIQDLLLGINAHINYDLVFTLCDMLEPEWKQLTASERNQRHADHIQVNQIIAKTIDAVQDQVLETLVPEMDLVDRLMGPIDEWMISELISHWRDEVWEQAVSLIETNDLKARERREKEIETLTQNRASIILLEGSGLNIIDLV